MHLVYKYELSRILSSEGIKEMCIILTNVINNLKSLYSNQKIVKKLLKSPTYKKSRS